MKPELIIKNARIVNEHTEVEADVAVRKGRIDVIAPEIAAADGVTVLDAGGKYLVPGMIDDDVNFRVPGVSEKWDFHS